MAAVAPRSALHGATPTELARVRAELGASNALWAGPDGVEVRDDGWHAFSGTASVDHNVVLCAAGGEAIDRAVECILERRVPAVLMVAGDALGEVQRLITRSWVCVGSTPVMIRELADGTATPSVSIATGRLTASEQIDQARLLVLGAFDLDTSLAEIVFPQPSAGHSLWGAFDAEGELRACLALFGVGDSVVVLSMATDAATQGRGFGAAALQAALANAAAHGAQRALLYSSPASDGFYRRMGFGDVERWQIWSRPRWVLGRT